MELSTQQLLSRLGGGESIQSLCAASGMRRDQFDTWWKAECQRRVPADQGEVAVPGVRDQVRITRDARGLPHVEAQNDTDLFFGFGYAVAQDRLFQIDYLRQRACGRLAKILGPEVVPSDILNRTLDLAGIAAAEWESFGDEIRSLVQSYAAGINALISASQNCLPIEFDLLGYEPEPWSPVDSLAIMGEFRWYLTGRFPVIVVPELVKRAVGPGPLYDAFLAGEADDECILPPGSYRRRRPIADSMSGHSGDLGPGSNNWVLTGTRTDNGLPVVASDPHIPFAAVSLWHEIHLRGGSFHVAGVAPTGMPGIVIGRNERVAWGLTNNICSQRDLYQERTDAAHPDCFQYDGQWEPAQRREEIIEVRGAVPIKHIVVSSRNGPIVDQLLPDAARQTGPVSLRWLGSEPCGWLPAVVKSNRARTIEEYRGALGPWQVPTFSLVFADVDGHIGYQCAGKIPVRTERERAYRPGWDPGHQWQGVIPSEAMPSVTDPPRGFVVTANNRVAPDDYPQPLSGTWVTGYRARRIREQIESRPKMQRDDHRRLQLDVYSGRAAKCVPAVIARLGGSDDVRIQRALAELKAWDFHARSDSIAATVFSVFFAHWCRAVAAERLPPQAADLVATGAGPLAVRLLCDDDSGWFVRRDRASFIQDAMRTALDELATRLGPDIEQWRWGRLHGLTQKHFLSGRGDLGLLLDHPRLEMDGDAHTVNSSTPDANHAAWLGAGYRFVAELADAQAGWWSIEISGSSGHPGSPYYGQPLARWRAGETNYTPLRGKIEGRTLSLVVKR